MSTTYRILVVDDEPQIRRFLRISLEAEDYSVVEAQSGKEAVIKAATEKPELVVLDLGLPDLDGLEVLKQIREWSEVPVLVLSVRGRESDKISALDNGADDYVTKPFGVGELVARIKAVLRGRARRQTEEATFVSGALTVDLLRRAVLLDGQELKFTRTEYNLLKVLVENAGKVVTHKQLLKEVWGLQTETHAHYVRVYIGQLRQKLESEPCKPRLIVTEPGVGYRLREM